MQLLQICTHKFKIPKIAGNETKKLTFFIFCPVINDPSQVGHPRRCRRKRLCSNFARKTLGYQQYLGNQLTPDLGLDRPLPGLDATVVVEKRVAPEVESEAGVSDGIATDATGYKDAPVAPGPAPSGHVPTHPARRTLFDDIFNVRTTD